MSKARRGQHSPRYAKPSEGIVRRGLRRSWRRQRTLDAAGVTLSYEADERVAKQAFEATEETVLSLAVRKR